MIVDLFKQSQSIWDCIMLAKCKVMACSYHNSSICMLILGRRNNLTAKKVYKPILACVKTNEQSSRQMSLVMKLSCFNDKCL